MSKLGNNMYELIGKLRDVAGITPTTDAPAAKKEPVYESVEPRGSISEAVKNLESKYAEFKESKAKPDFLDVDGDGNKKEPFKKAVKDKKQVEEGYDELTDIDDYQFAEPDSDAAVKPAKSKAEKAETRRRIQNLADKHREKDDWFDGGAKTSNVRTHHAKFQDEPEDELNEYSQEEYDQAIGDFKAKGGRATQLPPGSAKNPISTASRHIGGRGEVTKKGKGTRVGKDAASTSTKPVVDVYEVAPPGDKAERMVKHIKQGYAKDGKLTKKEKGIAYATAWKAHNKGQVEEGVEFKDTVKNSTPHLNKVKPAKLKEGKEAIRNHPIYTDKAAWDHYKAELDEQEMMDAQQPMPSAMHELDEIAKLAGLKTEMNPQLPGDTDSPLTHAGCPVCNADPCECNRTMDEEMEMEGNEFSGALAKAKAAGAKEFTVGGKRYAIKEDITLTADGDDVANLLRKLAGLDPINTVNVDPEPAGSEYVEIPQDDIETAIDELPVTVPGQEVEPVDEERDIEYLNTPREQTAGVDAAIPSGSDLNRGKKQYRKEYPGDNPMAVKETVEDTLWKKYSGMLKGLIK